MLRLRVYVWRHIAWQFVLNVAALSTVARRSIKELGDGLEKTKPSTHVALKREDGTACKDAEENAERFNKHFLELYGRKE